MARGRSVARAGLVTALLSLPVAPSRAAEPGVAAAPSSAKYAAGSATFCVVDPFVIAYRAPAGQKRPGAFDPKLSYTSRPVAERQAIRDYFVLALLERFIKPGAARPAPTAALPNPFAARGVQVELRASKAAPAAAGRSAPAK